MNKELRIVKNIINASRETVTKSKELGNDYMVSINENVIYHNGFDINILILTKDKNSIYYLLNNIGNFISENLLEKCPIEIVKLFTTKNGQKHLINYITGKEAFLIKD